MSAGTDPTSGGSVLSVPSGGGAIGGLGETFAPDLFTGTGNFSVPIALPPGRNGLAPQLSLGYSTGHGNGPFGLGWALSLPGVARKTARGVPRYDGGDVFVLSGAEDLVPVPVPGGGPGRQRYRPRTERLFARIEHVRGAAADATGDYWEVRSRDGMLTRYGTPPPAGAPAGWRDPATVRAPDGERIFAWRITETIDPLGNLIRYTYRRDQGAEPGHAWDQPVIARIEYADYGDRADPSFLVRVDFGYEPRPDPCSDHRSGFEIRSTLRCNAIRIGTRAADGVPRPLREYRFSYRRAPFNGACLLTRVDVEGIDGEGIDGEAREAMPPLSFGYTGFDPARRRFRPVTGPGLPTAPLSDPSLALVDLRGGGLPDLVELGATRRYWSNRGGGRFDLPRTITEAPPHALGEPGVRFLDANGDGRPDLLVTTNGQAGYFPMTFSGGWSRRSFQPYRAVPGVGLDDPAVRLVDLDGDGLTDVLRSGSRLECWFNDADPRRAWQRTATSGGSAGGLDLADPHVRLADMTGDGLQDLVLVRNGNIAYWPNLGHGRFGPMVQMRRAPRLPEGHDPRRLLLGDVDGDGVADLVYVDRGRVLLWGNQTGNAWTPEPVTITGTPDVVDTDSVQLADLAGTGMAGVLWSRAAAGTGQPSMRFLDLTGGVKPHLLDTMDNHLGALTTVRYRPSTAYFLADAADPATRWRTTLPFPVQVVARVEVRDQISGGRLVSEYRYHHGYWDGVDREFRGFAMVEHLDTETFPGSPAPGSPAPGSSAHHSPPTLSRSWFHVGPVAADGTAAGEAAGGAADWAELDLRHEYWPDDPPLLRRPAAMVRALARLPRPARRDALRAMRGQLLRTELYALDGTDRQDRPYTVTESLPGVRREADGVYFAFGLAQRTTQWERGSDPMTQCAFTAGHDEYGLVTRQLSVAVPRGRDPRQPAPAATEPYLATYATTEYARRDDAGLYLVDRVARTTGYEVRNDGRRSVAALHDAVLAGPVPGDDVSLRVIGHERTYYDGPADDGLPLGEIGAHGLPLGEIGAHGLPLGEIGAHGLPVRSESLAFTDAFLAELFDPADPLAVGPRPAYLDPAGTAWPAEYPPQFRDLLPPLAGYRHYRDADVPGSPGGYYLVTARHRYDVHDPARVPRGLRLSTLDPLGAQARMDYDEHDLLPVRATDAAGLTTEARYDLRVLRPVAVTDANGSSHAVAYSPAGLVTARFVRGKDGQGDATAPSVRIEHDLLAFAERGQPVSARSIRRVHHDTEPGVPAAERDEVIVSVEYSDGFGRLLQTRTQAEDTLFGDPAFGGGVLPAEPGTPAPATTGRTRQPGDPDNVLVSGWQVYDNKGRVVEKYEPFFATGFEVAPPADAQLGQKATISYDPRGQAVRTRNPDGSEQRTVLGVPVDLADPEVFVPTPWESFGYDANDNAGRTHPDRTHGYRSHWNTPASIELDALGRTVVATARNGPDPATDWHVTRSRYDIQGNLVAITDALGRPAFTYRFDLANRRWRMDSIDAGRHDTVPDALGNAVESRDAKGALALGALDRLHRPTLVWARDDATGPVTLRQRLEYGDGGDPDQPAAERQAARARNLLGRAVAHYDEAGVVTVAEADFKGNVLDCTRRVIADEPVLATYRQAAADGWRVRPFQVDWQPGPGQTPAERAGELLEATGYRQTTSFDALNRVTRHLLPQDVEGRRRELRPRYNRAGQLEQVRLDGTGYVQRIGYDAKGQRTLVAYGNGVLTRYAYDPRTFRLARLRTERYALDGLTYRPTGPALQDHGYEHDLAGNLLTIRDRTPGSGIPGSPAGADGLDRRFSYDPVYRLRTATGRECDLPPSGPPWPDLPRCTDLTRTRAYTETYDHDAVGSLLRLTHRTGPSGFTRDFATGSGANRLRRMTTGGTPFDYQFDACGNVLAETTSRHFGWNHGDQLIAFATQTAGAEPSIHAQYLYDAAGERVKKLVRHQGGAVEVTHYLGAAEHHRWSGAAPGGTTRVHVLDDRARIALVRIGPAAPGDGGPAVQFHLADHLGSCTVVVDDAGAVTNREEFTPYGETSFGSFARKRYRFTGRERDEESGLTRCGVRFLAAWTGRWFSCDPAGPGGGLNLYAYAHGSPMCLVDPGGRSPEDPVQGLPRDENGVLQLPGETIYVNDTKPDNLSLQIANGNSYFKSMEEHERQLTFAIEEAGTYTMAERVAAYQKDPAGATRKWNEYRTSTYQRQRRAAAADLEKQQTRMDTAYVFGTGFGVGIPATAGLIVGGILAAPELAAAGQQTLAFGNRLAVSIFNSGPKLFLVAAGYGIFAAPGSPDMPGPVDDLGRAARPLLSSAITEFGLGSATERQILERMRDLVLLIRPNGATAKAIVKHGSQVLDINRATGRAPSRSWEVAKTMLDEVGTIITRGEGGKEAVGTLRRMLQELAELAERRRSE